MTSRLSSFSFSSSTVVATTPCRGNARGRMSWCFWPMTWAIPIWAATAARFRRRISMRWRRTACGSRSSTTRPAAGRRGRRCSPATTPSRFAATRCRACAAAAGGARPAWARLLPEMLKPLGYRSYHSGKWHVDGKVLDGGFDHSYLMQDAGRFFSPQNHRKTTSRCRRCSATAATTRRRRSPIMRSST